jgi:hypothetical protein
LYRFSIILRHTVCILIAGTKVILSGRITLLTSFKVPTDSSYNVSFDSKAFIITSSEQPLCFSNSQFSRLCPFFQPVVKVPADVQPAALTGTHSPLALFYIRKADLPQVLCVGLCAAALRTKPGAIGNLCLAFRAFHKIALIYRVTSIPKIQFYGGHDAMKSSDLRKA